MGATDLYKGIDTSQFRGHTVSLEGFEGPLDLLLHLVQKDRVDIREISVSRITRQYLDYLKTLEALNVEIAGEFLVMAASLMRIKSQMLLPRPELPTGEDDQLPMTREELIQKLLEFQRYKEAARGLRQLEERRRKCLPRGWTPQLPKNHRYPLREVGVVDLLSYLRHAIDRADEGPPLHEVEMEEVRLEERIQTVLERVGGSDGPLLFHDLLERPWWRLEWIITFLAVLELVRLGSLVVIQEEPFEEIWLLKNGEQPAKPAEAEPAVERLQPNEEMAS